MLFRSQRKQTLGSACFNSFYEHILQAVFELKPQVLDLFGREGDDLQVVVHAFEPEHIRYAVS